MLVEVGRVCVKIVGHEANQKCVVIDNAGDGFVVVCGPRVKKRRCNIRHLELLPHKIDVKKGASEKEAIDALLKAGLISEINLKQKPAEYTPRPRGVEVKATPAKKAAIKVKK